ncbi:MAG: ABC transporter ATP-binding protein/permease [Clostridiales bacterium]|nr:ABC transporter ATP-binding protein/permease [Clostridiales bacterium]
MTKLIRFLKPFTLLVIIAIGLLYFQAMTDLALPDYMSGIVNNGIQQGGYETVKLEVVKSEDMNVMTMILSEDEKDTLLSFYNQVDLNQDTAAYDELSRKYTNLDRSLVYNLKPLDDENQTIIGDITTKMLIGIAKMNGATVDFEVMSEQTQKQVALGIVKTYNEQLGVDGVKFQRDYILRTGGKMLLIALAGAVASIAVGFIAAKVAAGMGRNLRKAVFTKVASFSSFEMDHFTTASLITRSTNDITQIQNLMVMMIRMLFYAPIIGVGGILKALEKSTSMSWIIALAVIVLLGVIIVVFSIALPKFKAIQKMVDGLNRVIRENLSGMMVTRAFNTQSFEEQRFDDANQNLTKTNLFVGRIMSFLFPVMMLIMNGVTLLIVWVGAKQIEASAMQVGDMMAFMQYALQIIMAFLMLSMMFIMIPRATVSAGRISEVLDKDIMIHDPESPKSVNTAGSGRVVFDNVSFKYPGAEENMLKNISFVAEPGKTTAIIGSTGCGKSTLVNLIPRFYDATEGTISIDNVPIHLMKQSDLRSIIGYVPQKAILFSGTIESNLKFGDQFAEDQVIDKAIDIAQASEIINEKNEGMSAPISQGGTNVSGGQKQRLSIARALVKQPKIYIFDDSFSALDFKTDSALRSAMKTKMEEATVLLVAQRVSTIKNADQILVLDEGIMVGHGTHAMLMETCSTYKEIAMSQLSEEELS